MTRQFNASAASNPGFLTNLLANLDSDTGAAVGEGMNAMAAGGVGSPLYITLAGTQQHTAAAIADALEGNTAFADALVKHLDAALLGPAISAGLYPLLGSAFLADFLGYAGEPGVKGTAESLASTMNSPQGQNLTNQLLANLDGSRVAQGGPAA